MTKTIENRLNELLLSLNRAKIEDAIDDLETKIKDLVIQKKILKFLWGVDFSLAELKNNLDEINKESRNLTLSMIEKAINICKKIGNKLNSRVQTEINNSTQLIGSWAEINATFNFKNISEAEFKELNKRFNTIMNIDKRLETNNYLPTLFTKLEEEINDYKKKVKLIGDLILDYWNKFSDQQFVERLVKGEKLSIIDLNPKMYKELYDSELRDKINISLKESGKK